jgi:hypothetical protein
MRSRNDGSLWSIKVRPFAHTQATEERGENARLSSFVGAMALGDLVKSTLGPKGMNKILRKPSSSFKKRQLTVQNQRQMDPSR